MTRMATPEEFCALSAARLETHGGAGLTRRHQTPVEPRPTQRSLAIPKHQRKYDAKGVIQCNDRTSCFAY